MSTHNICFYGEIRNIIPELSPNKEYLVMEYNAEDDKLCIILHFLPFSQDNSHLLLADGVDS